MPPLRAIVFDAYGTLFDVHSVIALCEQLWPGKGTALSALWRAKQLEYTWQRSLMRRYEDFARITEASLSYACLALGLPVDEERRRSLMGAYLKLSLFPEVRDALATLKVSKKSTNRRLQYTDSRRRDCERRRRRSVSFRATAGMHAERSPSVSARSGSTVPACLSMSWARRPITSSAVFASCRP